MPNWNEVLSELGGLNKGPNDLLRLKYLKQLKSHTKRNVLAYYSGWLQKPGLRNFDFGINDSDVTGFMTCSNKVDRKLGLDLILHIPGGSVAATEALVNYLKSLYDGNVRAIVPQLAMSGGTLIALSAKQIVMGRQSSLGPVDPQINGVPAQSLIEEFERAKAEIAADPAVLAAWQFILSKYTPTLLSNCQHAIDWSNQLLRSFLAQSMLKDREQADRDVITESAERLFGKQTESKNHARHLTADQVQNIGIDVVRLEEDSKLQDIVLTLHHAYCIAFSQTPALKIIENHLGIAFVPSMLETAS